MKTLVITSILALGVAGSAIAGGNNGLTLGQNAQVMLQAHEESANDRNTFFGNSRVNFSSKNIHSDRAAAIFAELKAAAAEDE